MKALAALLGICLVATLATNASAQKRQKGVENKPPASDYSTGKGQKWGPSRMRRDREKALDAHFKRR